MVAHQGGLMDEGGMDGLTSEYIMIFQVSTGRSASLKLQSKGSGAMGSSEGSW